MAVRRCMVAVAVAAAANIIEPVLEIVTKDASAAR